MIEVVEFFVWGLIVQFRFFCEFLYSELALHLETMCSE